MLLLVNNGIVRVLVWLFAGFFLGFPPKISCTALSTLWDFWKSFFKFCLF